MINRFPSKNMDISEYSNLTLTMFMKGTGYVRDLIIAAEELFVVKRSTVTIFLLPTKKLGATMMVLNFTKSIAFLKPVR